MKVKEIAMGTPYGCNKNKRQQSFRRGQPRIDVDLADARCSATNSLNFTGTPSSAVLSTALRPSHSLKGGEDLRPFHQPPCERGVERGLAEYTVAVDFDKLPSRSKEKNRSELRVDAACENELVALRANHGLHRDTQKCFCARFDGDRIRSSPVGLLHLVSIREIKLPAPNVEVTRPRRPSRYCRHPNR